MLETTSNVELFLPIVFALFTSYGAATLVIKKSNYGLALRSKNIPILNKAMPKVNKGLTAFDIMISHPISFKFIAKVSDVYDQLSKTEFNGFPVLNSKG